MSKHLAVIIPEYNDGQDYPPFWAYMLLDVMQDHVLLHYNVQNTTHIIYKWDFQPCSKCRGWR